MKPRDRLLHTAADLFYRQGIHATGIDAVVAGAAVARMTLYKHFPSKDALVLAVLQQHLAAAQARLAALVQAPYPRAEARLRHFFELLDETFRAPDYYGCPFINATAEFGDAGHPVHQLAAAYKRMYREALLAMVQPLGIPIAAALADQLFLLVEGAFVTAQVDRTQRPAQTAWAAASLLLSAHQAQR